MKTILILYIISFALILFATINAYTKKDFIILTPNAIAMILLIIGLIISKKDYEEKYQNEYSYAMKKGGVTSAGTVYINPEFSDGTGLGWIN